MREEREISDERRLAAKMVAQAKATAPRLAKMHAVSEYRGRWVAYQVRDRATKTCVEEHDFRLASPFTHAVVRTPVVLLLVSYAHGCLVFLCAWWLTC